VMPAPLAPAPAPLLPPAGFRLAEGTVAARSRAAGFSHVVRCGRASALGSVVVPSLLDAASHGPAGRWVLLRRVAH
jgi:hypothetical protein